jgi:hypothetical protein
MIWLVGVTIVVTIAPVVFAGIAWWLLFHTSPHISGRLARFVLCLNSASALMFAVTITLASSGIMTETSVYRISAPNVFLCITIAVLSLIKIGHQLYQAVFISSGILAAGWLIIASLH